jgi:hypothetical protein
VDEILSIDAVVASVRTWPLTDASLADALELTFARLTELCSSRHIDRFVTIVLSDGRRGGEQLPRTLAMADRFKDRGWLLCMTGTGSTAKEILLAANKGRLVWSLVSEANPAIWLQSRVAEEPAAKTMEGQPPAEKTTAPEPQQEKKPEAKPADRPPGPPPAEPRTIHEEPQDHTASQPQGPAYSVTTRIDTVTAVGPLPQLPSSVAASPPAMPPVPLPQPALEANEPSGLAVGPLVETSKDRPHLRQSLWKTFWRRPGRTLLWAIPPLLIGLAAVAMVLFSGGFKEARQWSARIHSRQQASRATGDAGILIVRANDQTHRLGRLDQIRSVHIGSGEKNTIRIPDRSLDDRHLRLYGKGRGLMLQNLSRTPLFANGSMVKPGRKVSVIMPSAVKLNERVTLDLELERPQPIPKTTDNRSDQREPTQ